MGLTEACENPGRNTRQAQINPSIVIAQLVLWLLFRPNHWGLKDHGVLRWLSGQNLLDSLLQILSGHFKVALLKRYDI